MLPVLLSGNKKKARYPTIANSLLWIDYANSCTDANGLTPATAGQSVQTIRLPSGWGASLGDGLVRQTTSGNRPTWQTNGLQSNGSSTYMVLPGDITLSGDYTIYMVAERAAVTALIYAGQAASTKSLVSFTDSKYYHWSGSILQATDAATGLVIRKVRRSGVSTTFRVGGVNTSQNDSETIVINQIIARQVPVNLVTDSSNRYCQLVIVERTITDGHADETAIISRLQPGASWS